MNIDFGIGYSYNDHRHKNAGPLLTTESEIAFTAAAQPSPDIHSRIHNNLAI